ncbi:MAG: mechanosensitive ion channel [Eubacterium sp.]|nr:mechanosensitive ion channel [Eubacterium sp.]
MITEETINKVIQLGIKVVIAVVVLIVGINLIKFIIGRIRKHFKRIGIEDGLAQFICSVIRFVLYFVLVLSIVSTFGIATSSVVAILGSSGLTLGLALQGSLSNFAGGVLILLQKPFVVGDYIREDTHGNEGTVSNISMIYTRLTTINNNTVVIPNAVLANSSLVNYTSLGVRQADITIGISYNADIKKAKDILADIVKNDERIIKDRDLNVFVRALSESSVDLGVRFFAPADIYWKTYWDYLEKAKIALDEAGIEIPYPQITVSYEKDKQ